ncbi:L,D-transpeptidase family protein [Altererythrobacter sp. MTPC7]|uniref:L,D-transpeptidase family protein n=1 Tax=Altererythrobacter sp. MTPC7 TaxID=3056567 RepID=UPI0036F35AAF
MNPMLKWIGGATAATLLVFGGATLASTMLDSQAATGAGDSEDAAMDAVTAIDRAIPVDEAKLDGSDVSAQALSSETVPSNAASGPSGQADGEARLQQASASDVKDDDFVVKSILPIDGPIKYGEYHWDASRAPADGKLVMTVDLQARVISVFKGGHEIGASAVLLGTDKHPTPLGTFPIRYKMRHNVSEKYNNAPMPYSMFLTTDGIALHGSDVENGYASHGCVGMPDEFAAKVFALAKKGDKVIITDGETLEMGEQIL